MSFESHITFSNFVRSEKKRKGKDHDCKALQGEGNGSTSWSASPIFVVTISKTQGSPSSTEQHCQTPPLTNAKKKSIIDNNYRIDVIFEEEKQIRAAMPRKKGGKNSKKDENKEQVSIATPIEDIPDSTERLENDRNSDESGTPSEEKEAEEGKLKNEVWEIVEMISTSETNSSQVCRTDNCEEQAVAVWSSNLKSNESWPICEKCQKSKFEGWPDGFMKPCEKEEDKEEGEIKTKEPKGEVEDLSEQESEQQEILDSLKATSKNKIDQTSSQSSMVLEQFQRKQEAKTSAESMEAQVNETMNVEEQVQDKVKASTRTTSPTLQGDDEVHPEYNGSQHVGELEQELQGDIKELREGEASITKEKQGDTAATLKVESDWEETKAGTIINCGGDKMYNENINPENEGGSNKGDDFVVERNTKTPQEDRYTKDISGKDTNGVEEEIEESWEMTKVMSVEELMCKRPIKCSSENCPLSAAVVYVSNLAPDEDWNCCLDCQELDFGGWPDINEVPIQHMEQEHKELLIKKCSGKNDIEMPIFEEAEVRDKCEENDDSSKGKKEATEGNDDTENQLEEAWELKKIMSVAAVSNDCPIKCCTETCTLPAAVVYVSNLAPTENWYSCLDCQENDFGGWPELEELPLKQMTSEHKKTLVDRCSKYKDVEMPDFPAATESPRKDVETTRALSSNTVTPPPNGAVSQNLAIREKIQGKATVTPNPETTGNKNAGSISSTKPATAKPTKQMLETHRKWQEAAEAMGGPGARIIVSKSDAKRLIYDYLYDGFRPMNITDIYKNLKATVPNIVLKTCLDDMALDSDTTNQFADSDDEEDEPKKKAKKDPSEHPFDASLCFKAGRNTNTNLYFVDYNNAKNGGGLEREEKNDLAAKLAKADADRDALKTTIKQLEGEITKLLSEPTNEEATAKLEIEESSLVDLTAELEAANALKVNEKYKKQLKRNIGTMTTEWRKRRRICMDFLIAMEENTEGTISVKKCLSGDGQIDIDSDQVVAKHAIEYGKKKRARPLSLKKHSFKNFKASGGSSQLADESFVAVLLDSKGCVSRVHLDDN